MGTVHDFPEGLQREDWPVDYSEAGANGEWLQGEAYVDDDPPPPTLLRQFVEAVLCSVAGLLVVTGAALAINAVLAVYVPVVTDNPVNP